MEKRNYQIKDAWINCAKCGRRHKWRGGRKTAIAVMCNEKYFKQEYIYETITFPIMCKNCVESLKNWWKNET